MKKVSLLTFCKPCRAACCKTGSLIGSPIISQEEREALSKKDRFRLKHITPPTGESYFIIKEQSHTNRCHFLTEENTCRIQKHKPMDCLCYPIKAVYRNRAISYILDNDCPACPHLSSSFIQEAKRIAKTSLLRFKKETYEHWLANYVGWVRDAPLLENMQK